MTGISRQLGGSRIPAYTVMTGENVVSRTVLAAPYADALTYTTG